MNCADRELQGVQLLIVEDEYLLAQDMAEYFENLGVEIVGPVGSVADALALLGSSEVQVAVLDVNLRNERVYPVADALRRKHIPFVFASGYGRELEPDAYADVPRCLKPVDCGILAQILRHQIGGRSTNAGSQTQP